MTGENETKELLVQFEQNYPWVTRDTNVDAIAGNLQKKRNRASILAILREHQNPKDEATSENPVRRQHASNR